jgi:hypothetical protein
MQGAWGWRPVFVMPIDLYFGLPSGDTTIVVQNNDTLQTYQFELSEIPTAVYLDPDEWILRYAQLGVEETEVREQRTEVRLTLLPNPVHSSCVVEYSIAKARHVSIDLFDVSGRCVKNLACGKKDAGVYRINIDARTIPAGIYFVRMNGSLRRKLVVLR